MKINNDHMYHGAALTQIAEHPQFTAINAFVTRTETSRCGFLVNQDIGIYLKYATKPNKSFAEFVFTFTDDNITEIDTLAQKAGRTFIVFICVQAKEICCISRDQFKSLIAKRRKALGSDERVHTIIITIPNGRNCRVYMNYPGTRRKCLGKFTVPRNKFPMALFEKLN